ncbi:YciI family protein [Sphingomonas sp. PAMC 26617]|uniref:YciI family protein n=1 Tax=Sphingomonas sp. PAMC 26617 TaxID=1112216 RepID=UPI000289533B|nr:YciI family protein [Sphingomonas sp. PAMC 26617]
MAGGFRADGPLCLILLDYGESVEAVDAQMPHHVAWLEKGFAEGVFLVAGRQNPRTGGVIVARGQKAEAEALAATDPFVTGGVATARVIQFNASFAAPEIAALLA